jgi:hypothetical protein
LGGVRWFRRAPSLHIRLDRFAKVGTGGFDILALRSYTEFRAARDVKRVFFSDEDGKATIHMPMLAENLATVQQDDNWNAR